MSDLKPLRLDIVSDVVCPWCYIGKHRIEDALKLVPDVPVEVHWRPFFLNNWVPREGISRDEYLTAKFGSVDAYKGIAGRVVAAANEEGLTYHPELVKRQPNTIDCHRLIHWAEAKGKAAEMKQRLMELYFRDGGDLTDSNVLVQAAADVGLDADDIRKRLASDEDVALVSAQAQEAAEKGISGVPTFVFAQKYAVSGAQPAEQLARAIRRMRERRVSAIPSTAALYVACGHDAVRKIFLATFRALPNILARATRSSAAENRCPGALRFAPFTWSPKFRACLAIGKT